MPNNQNKITAKLSLIQKLNDDSVDRGVSDATV
jgi:hypothetical protein